MMINKSIVVICISALTIALCGCNNGKVSGYSNSLPQRQTTLSQVTQVVNPINSPSTSATEQLDASLSSPQGIFVSSGPRISDKVLSMPVVSGNLIRVGWDEIEPRPGEYDFSQISALITQAKTHGKQVTLSVLNGPRAPKWLYQKGAAAFEYMFKTRYSERGNRSEVIPIPWDPVYLTYWLKLVAALGDEFAQEPALALVHITHASKNGFEMQLPEERVLGRPESVSSGPWHEAGYTERLYIAALKQITDAFAQAFPQHPIDIEIHPVLGSLTPAKEIFTYGIDKYGSRFGLFSAWWSGKVQPWNKDMLPLITSACQRSFCAMQLIGNQTRQPDRLLNGSLSSAMAAAQSMGAKYYEVWDVDVRNPALLTTLEAFSSH
jgi:hypothetical protein